MLVAQQSQVRGGASSSSPSPPFCRIRERQPSTAVGLWRKALLGFVVLVSGAACAHRNIVNTEVDDNPFNREVIGFCEKYRKAVERRSVGELLKMAHPMYFEDGGNVDASDDMDYDQLREYLQSKFADAKAIRYEIRYRKVGRGTKDEVLVDFTYSASYKIPTKKGDVWRRTVADNRLELVRDGESFRVLAGM